MLVSYVILELFQLIITSNHYTWWSQTTRVRVGTGLPFYNDPLSWDLIHFCFPNTKTIGRLTKLQHPHTCRGGRNRMPGSKEEIIPLGNALVFGDLVSHQTSVLSKKTLCSQWPGTVTILQQLQMGTTKKQEQEQNTNSATAVICFCLQCAAPK